MGITSSHLLTIYSVAGTKSAYVSERPEDLASEAGLDLDLYSLARCIESENGSDPRRYKIAVGECVRNEAFRRGITITQVVTQNVRIPEANGYYGEQWGRYASTRLDPSQDSVEVAQAVLEGSETVPHNANKWDSPIAQDKGVQGSHKLKPVEDIISDWYGEGYFWTGPIAGIDPYILLFFTKEDTGYSVPDVIARIRGPRYEDPGSNGQPVSDGQSGMSTSDFVLAIAVAVIFVGLVVLG